jgi:hypothetical protein
LLDKCGLTAVQVVGACRRRVEVNEEIAFVIQTEDFSTVLREVERHGGRTPLLESTKDDARFALSRRVNVAAAYARPSSTNAVGTSASKRTSLLRAVNLLRTSPIAELCDASADEELFDVGRTMKFLPSPADFAMGAELPR